MGIYRNDLSALSIGNGVPAGFTLRQGAANVTYNVADEAGTPGGKRLRATQGGSSRNLLGLNAVNSDADRGTADVIALCCRSSDIGASTASIGGVAARGDGTTTNTTHRAQVAAIGYDNTVSPAVNDLRHVNYKADSSPAITRFETDVYTQDEWVWVRVRVSGTTATVSIYPLNDPKGTPRQEFSATAAAASGNNWIGFWSFSIGSVIDWAYIGVGTGEDAAPLPLVPVLSDTDVSPIAATTATGRVTTTGRNGTLYAVVTTSATPPSGPNIRTGDGAVWSGNQAITSLGEKSFDATGLTVNVQYYWHFLHDDPYGQSSTVSTQGFETAASIVGLRLRVEQLIYTDRVKTTLVTESGYKAWVIDPSDDTLSKSFPSVSIVSGVLDIADALYETENDQYLVALKKGSFSRVFEATVIDPS